SRLHLAGPNLDGAAEGQTTADIIARDRREIEGVNARLSGVDKEGEKLKAHLEKLGQVRDLFYNEREKAAASRRLGETERVVVLEGWVKSADAAGLRSALEPYAGSSEVYLRPPLPDEEPPVILENPQSFRPFQVVTELFGLPGPDSRDPTMPLAPFFFVFVGLCVSEAGYGAVVTLLSLLYLKFARPKGGAGQFARLMLLLGISNILFGTLVGGWFGFPIR
ncbi:MAG: V-type ATPase kDa subunit, partial [Candidatus Aminicenantes bacterium]|nr:V-type ATPase kDa subunit [Candidatus Aminicenantes bacterium]